MTCVEAVLSRLDAVRKVGTGWEARCPAHDDRRASLSVKEGQEGRALLKCHAGCSTTSVVEKVGFSMRDLKRSPEPSRARRVESYDYTDEAGTVLFQVVRFEPKDFRHRRPDGRGGWLWNLENTRRVLFRLPSVVKAATRGGAVFIVEGEKDVLSLETLGLVATCNPAGAGKWRAEHAQSLKGCKGAVILPDNDEVGRKHAEDIARSLHAIGILAKVLELPGLAPKGDVSDWIRAGGTKADLYAMVKAAAWWKPAPPTVLAEGKGQDRIAGAVLRCVADVQPERVDWLWLHRIPLGKMTVLDGDPGLGKSTLTLDLAARVSRGTPMPDQAERREPAGVILLSAEDGIADTIRPRLEAAGADLTRVEVLTAVRDAEGLSRPPRVPDDVSMIREAALRSGARLIVLDPLMAFLGGKVDSHRDQDVRSALHLVAELAEETGAAVLVVRHLNKTQGGHAVYRGGGSIGIIGAARAGLIVGPDPKDETRRVLAVSKSNLGPVPPSLAYRLVPVGETSTISWEGDADCSAGEMLAAQREDSEGGESRSEIEAFLREALADGPVAIRKLQREAEQAGIQYRTLNRALHRIGAKRTKAGMAGGWYWSLPAEDDTNVPKMTGPESCHLRPRLSSSAPTDSEAETSAAFPPGPEPQGGDDQDVEVIA